jgi:Fur family peroxide stress response transcriptional regulator
MNRRHTKQREAIRLFLKSTRTHPTASQVYDAVRQRVPNISKGTVYRDLKVLQAEGAVVESSLPGTLSRFEARLDPHYHFRCDRCGRVFDLDEPVDKELDDRVTKRTGYKVSHHELEFRGICKYCQK